MTDPVFITQDEVAERWRISTATLERDRSLRQGLKYLKIGGLIRYRMSDLLEYEAKCEVKMKENQND